MTLGRDLPKDLKSFLISFGWGEGFASKSEAAEYLIFYSPTEISEYQPAECPKHLVVIGSNGGGEWIVVNDDLGYGLLPEISDYQKDYHHVASSLEGFLSSAMLGQWFSD
ncbi:SMI1/KNR4 family protein [Shimia sp.]|uniref:SMI1/KNR4 family protein n=1 Tax=Shimia sp. TaxID=1954381 RepID=UPI00341C8674